MTYEGPMKIAIVCSSNQNRSMEAHNFLRVQPEKGKILPRLVKMHMDIVAPCKKGFQVQSYGTGNQVKLPGPSSDKPNVYDFSTSYDEMYKDLRQKDPDLKKIVAVVNSYTQNGILHMLDRNRRIKPKPERFQACKEQFDIIITCEERVYDQVIDDLESRNKSDDGEAVHIINIDIQDNHEEATIGAFMICDLVTLLHTSDDLDNEIEEILQEYESNIERPILHAAAFY